MTQPKVTAEPTIETIIMTKKGIGYLVAAPVLLLIVGFYLLSIKVDSNEPAIFDDSKSETAIHDDASASDTASQQNTADTGSSETSKSTTQGAEETAIPVQTGEEQPIIGQFMRFQEIREPGDNNTSGTLRNMKFVFRPGILPHRLFEDNDQVILKYEQLHRNMVGSGAKTAFFYYEVVNKDTNGDGKLNRADGFNVAISRPTGGNYRVLAHNVDEVIEYEDLPVENALRLVVKMQGKEISRTYSLEGM